MHKINLLFASLIIPSCLYGGSPRDLSCRSPNPFVFSEDSSLCANSSTEHSGGLTESHTGLESNTNSQNNTPENGVLAFAPNRPNTTPNTVLIDEGRNAEKERPEQTNPFSQILDHPDFCKYLSACVITGMVLITGAVLLRLYLQPQDGVIPPPNNNRTDNSLHGDNSTTVQSVYTYATNLIPTTMAALWTTTSISPPTATFTSPPPSSWTDNPIAKNYSWKLLHDGKGGAAPIPRALHAFHAVGQYLYALFGFSTLYSTSRNDVWRFDPNAKKWVNLDVEGLSPPTRAGSVSAVIGSDIYVYGGLQGSWCSSVLGDFWKFNTILRTWTEIVPTNSVRPGPRFGAGGAAIGNTFYLAGGASTDCLSHFYNDLWKFDGVNWISSTPGASLERVLGGMVATSDSKFYLFSGTLNPSSGSPLLDDMAIFDPEIGWTIPIYNLSASASQPRRRAAPAMGYINRTPVVFGGGDVRNLAVGETFNDVWMFNPSTSEWRNIIKANQPGSPSPRALTGNFATIGDCLYLFGGHDGTKVLNDLWQLCPDPQ